MVADSDFIAPLGRPFLAHRLRRLSEMFLDGYAKMLPELGVGVPARSRSTMLLLDQLQSAGVTDLAARLRLSHPFMIKMVAELEAGGFVAAGSDAQDARRRPVRLTDAGLQEVGRIRAAVAIIDAAYRELFAEIGVDLTDAVARAEDACLREPFHRRLARAAGQPQEKELPCDVQPSPVS